jgi:hypothetical protein
LQEETGGCEKLRKLDPRRNVAAFLKVRAASGCGSKNL